VEVPADPELLRQGLTCCMTARRADPGQERAIRGRAGAGDRGSPEAGILLVQLAIAAGGHVVAAARGERKLDCSGAGRRAVDYSAPEWTQIVRRVPAAPDLM